MHQFPDRTPRRPARPVFLAALFFLLCLVRGLPGVPVESLAAPQSTAEPGSEAQPDYSWAPTLLYDIISSPNSDALDYLYDSTFAAGDSMVPQLIQALKDDRTAEFAAQSLAFIGGERALSALSKLVNDRRDLDLRRFYYGALGEFDTPQANQILVNIIRNANNEPDRTVTEVAIIALTVHSDSSLVPALKQAEATLTDPVIQDDLENALTIVQSRARYLAAQPGRSAGGSVARAIRIYFLPALESSSGRALPGHATSRLRKPAGGAPHSVQPESSTKLERLVFSPDQTRALAHVVFTDPAAVAHYQMVLQKQYGDWTVASVWLGPEEERNPER